MQNSLKKAVSAVLCGALALTACGCGNTTGTALTVNNSDVRAGIYIYYQMDALTAATSVLTEEQPDIDLYAEDFDIAKHTIEGTPAEEWIKNKTISLCKEHIAVDKLFESYGLSLTAEETKAIKDNVFAAWNEENMYAQYIYGVDILGDYYESLGIGEKSFEDCLLNSAKREAVFEHIYGEGGEKAVSVDELNKSIIESYALTYQFEVDAAVASAQTYVDMINAGESVSAANMAYEKDVLVKEVTDAMAEAEAAGEEYDGLLPEEVEADEVTDNELKVMVEKDSEYPTAEFVNEVFAMTAGETKVITVSDTTTTDGVESTKLSYYVVKRADIAADAETMESYRESALHELKDEEFDGILKTESDSYSVTENSAAIKLYTIDKLRK